NRNAVSRPNSAIGRVERRRESQGACCYLVGVGDVWSFCTHDDKSKTRNSSAFCWPVSPPAPTHPLMFSGLPEPMTWRSLKTARPHCCSSFAVIGVLKLKYFGFPGREIHVVAGAFTPVIDAVTLLNGTLPSVDVPPVSYSH